MPKPVPPRPLPCLDALTAGLNTVLVNGAVPGEKLRIRERVPAIWSSTYPSEIVTCRAGQRELRLYCKYMAGLRYQSYGHRGGLQYETEVYRRILQSSLLPTARYYGAYLEPETRDVWLILEYLDGSLRLPKAPQPRSLLEAARWIGRFHSTNEPRVSRPAASFLSRYDSEYYLGWACRTVEYAHGLQPVLPWLEPLCGRFQQCAEILLSGPQTIIHGEFYPHNILVSDGIIYPIDWESAAIAAGEIDLAMLTEGWNPDDVRRCEAEYRQARWNGVTPRDFVRRLAVARLYQSLRWLGERRDWTLNKGNRYYFDQLRAIGEELQLI
jgi:aminoglycoside phosphotransferase (APT) family kinase protein